MNDEQLALKFNEAVEYNIDEFLVRPCNEAAYRAIESWHEWPERRLLLIGEAGSGKTHLAKLWQKLSCAIFLNATIDYQDLKPKACILENIDQFKDQTYLFHLINFCREQQLPLLLTSATLPTFALKDLQSRIEANYCVEITAPSEELVRILLVKHFSDRQIKVKKEVIDYLCARVERSFASIKTAIELIDKHITQHQKAVTIPLIKKVLEE
jgi:chromosomal replication initiation ATPase DnaA